MVTPIYILGRGHSGTTILDLLLGSAGDSHGVGELISGLAKFESGVCSCGAETSECKFWVNVKQEFEHLGHRWDDLDQLVRQAYVGNFFSTLFMSKAKQDYLEKLNTDLFDAIGRVANAEFVVDSTKEPTRGLLLAKTGNTKIVHIIRSPFDIIESNLHRIDSGQPFRFMRRNYTNRRMRYLFVAVSAFAWNIGFFLGALSKVWAGENYVRVFYRELYNKPDATLNVLANALGLSMAETIDRVRDQKPIPIVHRIAGNKIRFKKQIIFRNNREKKSLGKIEKLLVLIFAFPVYPFLRSRLK